MGRPPLDDQWRFNTNAIAGETLRTLTLPAISATNSGWYDVIVTNSFGSVTSAVAALSLRVLNLDMVAGLAVEGPVGATACVEWATEGGAPWQTLTNFVLPVSPCRIVDGESAGQRQRFHRVLFLPYGM